MDDLWIRVALVAMALAMAGAVVWLQRNRGAKRIRPADSGDLGPGVYLFSSSACDGCISARDKLVAHLGETGFTELSWEESPRVFVDVGVEAVPAVLVVSSVGEATVYPGQPGRVLRRV